MNSNIPTTSGEKLDRPQQEYSTAKSLLLLAVIFIGMMCVAMFFGALAQMPFGAGTRSGMLAANSCQNIFGFIGTAFIMGWIISHGRPLQWLTLDRCPTWGAFWFMLLSFPLIMPVIEWLEAWNASLHLPAFMSGVESWMRDMEAAASDVTLRLLSDTSVGALISGILLVGVLTGLGEELLFRGTLQKILTRGLGIHGAVWLSAFIFSAIHVQFLGFFPRLLMGVWFGYMLALTGSIWVPVMAHALNNSIVVVDSWQTARDAGGALTADSPSWLEQLVGSGNGMALAAAFGAVLLGVLWWLWIRGRLGRIAPLRKPFDIMAK